MAGTAARRGRRAVRPPPRALCWQVLAEWTIEGANADSAITNPVLGLEALLSYVNEWRDALADQPKLRAPPAATANGAQ